MPIVEVMKEIEKESFPEKLESVLKEGGIITCSEKTNKGKQLVAIFSDAIIVFSFDFNGKISKIEK